MQRRDFLKSVPPAIMMPQLRSAPRLKITDVRIVNLKTIRETGKMEAAWNPGTVTTHRIGGGSIIEIHTDQGLSGIGPAIDAPRWSAAKAQLVGKDPFDIEQLAGPLRYYAGQSPRTVSGLEIALWDLIGKAAGQPLYKLWGAAKDRVPAYASMIQLSTPEERVRMAVAAQIAGLEGDQASRALSDVEGRRAAGGGGAQSGGRRHGDHGGCQPGAVLRHMAAGRDVGFPPRAGDRPGTGAVELPLAGRTAAALRFR